MLRSLRTAALGMAAQQLNIDTIANNLANVNTTGYKKVMSGFRTYYTRRFIRVISVAKMIKKNQVRFK